MTRLYRTICRIVDAVSRGLDRLFARPRGGEVNPQLYRELEEAGYELIGFTETDDLTGKSELWIRPVMQDGDQEEGQA